MVIVSATRADLRDESVMTDDVFALSPISARAVQPSEADYEAIRDAFMETSRGRWFLGEYAKRNRNADTSMVLDAVARIEEVLASQRQAPPPDQRLAEALAAIRSALGRAAESAGAAFDHSAVEANLAPIRKGIVIIKEISWRWREIGADGRICDLIDSQLNAIEAGCGQIAGVDPHAALNQAFDLIKSSIDQFSEGNESAARDTVPAAAKPVADPESQPEAQGNAGDAAVSAEATLAEPTFAESTLAESTLAESTLAESTLAESMAAEPLERRQPAPPEAPATDDVEASAAEPMGAEQDVAAAHDIVRQHVPEGDVVATFVRDVATDVAAKSVASVEPAAEAAEAQAEADAHDEAVLDAVAAEMSAPDPIDIDDFSDAVADDIVVTMRPPEPIAVTPEPEPIAVTAAPMPEPAPVRPPIVQPFPQAVPAAASLPPSPAPVAASLPPAPPRVVTSFPPVQPMAARAAPEPAAEASLGSTIIANGLLQPVKPAANDPLAPIRRMTQVEKIAFFS
jgi:hypothetical protein